ncbi:hypothetical protein ACSNOK_15840 [Streptomyces sp. URMC 126]|uniref:hypothetical protein n=1 Tax=Streptomyces sp. URMC 126 TaxID=3423401 RepID=UPI003F1C71CC
MGKTSKKKQERRARRTPQASSPVSRAGVSCGDDAQALGTEALQRLLRLNSPGKLSLAGAYAFGYGALGYAQHEGTEPHWYSEMDPLDMLFLGTAWPGTFRDEYEFANARDAWLRLLRGSVHGKGIQRFVREVVAASKELGLPVDDGQLMLALVGRLEAAGLDQRRIPRRLLPETALQESRSVFGPPLDLQLPDPPVDSEKRIERFWRNAGKDFRADDSPIAVLRHGLNRFRDLGLSVEEEPVLLLGSLYAALMTKPGELLEDTGEHAAAWALSVDERSTLVPVLDILLLAPELGLSTSDTLKHLFAVPAFTEPIPSEALLWTSSPGLALARISFELGIAEVATRDTVVTPDMLDWVGMHARMSLSATARERAAEREHSDSVDGSDATDEGPDERWAERRAAVRETVLRKVRKNRSSTSAEHRATDHPVERIWNADGSSLVRISTETEHGRNLMEALEAQREAFRVKFGRDPGPGDPILFDPEADEPTRLTREHFDEMMLAMAECAVELGLDPAYIHASREVGYLVTTETMSMFTAAELIAYKRAVARHRQAASK